MKVRVKKIKQWVRYALILFPFVVLTLIFIARLFQPNFLSQRLTTFIKAASPAKNYSSFIRNSGFESSNQTLSAKLLGQSTSSVTDWQANKAKVTTNTDSKYKTEGNSSVRVEGKKGDGIQQQFTLANRDLVRYTMKVFAKKGGASVEVKDMRGNILGTTQTKLSNAWETLSLVPYPWASPDFQTKSKNGKKADIQYTLFISGKDDQNEFYVDAIQTERTGGSGKQCRLQDSNQVQTCQFYEYCDADPGVAGTCQYNPSWPQNLTDAQAMAIYETMKGPDVNKGVPLLLPPERLNIMREMYVRRYWTDAAADVIRCGIQTPVNCPEVTSALVRGEIGKLQETINSHTMEGVLRALYPDLSTGDIGILERRMADIQLSHTPRAMWETALVTCDVFAMVDVGPCAVVGRLVGKGIAAVGKPVLQLGKGFTSWVLDGAASLLGRGSELVNIQVAAARESMLDKALNFRYLPYIVRNGRKAVAAIQRWPSLANGKWEILNIDPPNIRDPLIPAKVFPINEVVVNANDGYISSQVPQVFQMLAQRFGVLNGRDMYVYVASSPKNFETLLERGVGTSLSTHGFIRVAINKNGQTVFAVVVNPALDSKWWYKLLFHEGIHRALVRERIGGITGWISSVTGQSYAPGNKAAFIEEFIVSTVSGSGYKDMRAEAARKLKDYILTDRAAQTGLSQAFNFRPGQTAPWNTLQEYIILKVIPDYVKSAAGANEFGLPVGRAALEQLNAKWLTATGKTFTNWLIENVDPYFWPKRDIIGKTQDEETAIAFPICSENLDCDTPMNDFRNTVIDSLNILTDSQNGLGLPNDVNLDKVVLDSAIELSEATKVYVNNDLQIPVNAYQPIVDDHKNWQLDQIPDIPTEMFEDSDSAWQVTPVTPTPTSPNPQPSVISNSPVPSVTAVPSQYPTLTPTRVNTPTLTPTPQMSAKCQVITFPTQLEEGGSYKDYKLRFENTSANFPWDSNIELRQTGGEQLYTSLPDPIPNTIPVCSGKGKTSRTTVCNTVDMPFQMYAPRGTAGTYELKFQLFDKRSNRFFGDMCTGTVTVPRDTRQSFDSACRSNTIPSEIVPGSSVPVSVELENTGYNEWSSRFDGIAATDLQLVSTTDTRNWFPQNIGTDRRVGPHDHYTWDFNLQVPANSEVNRTVTVEYKLFSRLLGAAGGTINGGCSKQVRIVRQLTPTLIPTIVPTRTPTPAGPQFRLNMTITENSPMSQAGSVYANKYYRVDICNTPSSTPGQVGIGCASQFIKIDHTGGDYMYDNLSVNLLKGRQWQIYLYPNFYNSASGDSIFYNGRVDFTTSLTSQTCPISTDCRINIALNDTHTSVDMNWTASIARPTATPRPLNPTPTASVSCPVTTSSGRICLRSDIISNCKIDLYDLTRVAACQGKTDASCTKADVNGDGVINQTDIDCVNSFYGETCTNAHEGVLAACIPPSNKVSTQSVPSPKTSLLDQVLKFFAR